MTLFEIIALAILALCAVLLVILLLRTGDKNSDRAVKAVQEESGRLRGDISAMQKTFLEENGRLRQELASANARFAEQLRSSIETSDNSQRESLKSITETTDRRLEGIQKSVTLSITDMAQRNESRLSQIRETVDEKLSATLNKRFAESFESIGNRLDAVNKGLGEMQSLAAGVGDLKKVLTNVKTRGTWGEIQLGALLDQILNPAQYKANVKVKPRSGDIVEYAIVLPGKESQKDAVYLPIDSKFPVESYQRLTDARENGDAAAQDAAQKELCAAVKQNAVTIKNKYIAPPYTTDFAIMYLPTEGLYSFVAADVSLLETLQRDHKITVMGPTTLGAFLNSLQMGFRTLAIQKQTGQIWKTVTQVRKDFEKFGGLLEKTKNKLIDASNTIDDAVKRTGLIQRQFDRLELPEQDGMPGGELE